MTEVEKNQHLLAYLEYYTGECDGQWGPQSIAACKAFQKDYCLEVDGICGPMTKKTMVGVIAGTVARKEPVVEPVQNVQNGNSTGTYWDRIKWFKRTDPYIACPCPRCGGFPVEPSESLMMEADLMRETLGHPMIPSSTVRCQLHNDELPGSVPNSYHVSGHAMDFDIPGVTDATIITYLNKRKAAGYISYWYQMSGGNFHFQVPKA